jgi:hypothetical protein
LNRDTENLRKKTQKEVLEIKSPFTQKKKAQWKVTAADYKWKSESQSSKIK